ncbi:hypothetical protein K431DRAFT_195007, partial [Polychaeton citri CBS 116435]
DAEHELDDLAQAKPKKKRRIVKNADKKYECPQVGCGKSYSRAEHLYRHQLNHAPKQIYRCDFPGCDRHFVRADLCTRHKERHTAKGSHLQRKDAFLSSQRGKSFSNGASEVLPQGPGQYITSPTENRQQYTNSRSVPTNGSAMMMQHPAQPMPSRRFSYDTMYSGRSLSHGSSLSQGHQVPLSGSMQPPPISSPVSAGTTYAHSYPSPSSTHQNFRSPSTFSPHLALPPFSYPQNHNMVNGGRQVTITSPPMTIAEQQTAPPSRVNSMADFSAIDQMATQYTIPVFGGDGFSRSPTGPMNDDFFVQLFNTAPNGAESINPSPPPGLWSASYTNGLDLNMRESTLSEKKRQRLLDLIVNRFNDVDQIPGRKRKDEILAGNKDSESHVLSLHMLRTYLTSFWVHIHQQMPILHRPTFNPETCPELLLLAMMCLGAVCLERSHPFDLTQASAEFSFFLAYHVRWEVFRDADFRPTAKLWTFQAMLLLEMFEKMYSTLDLHERAHIHHATTLVVMRRGSSLIGRSLEAQQEEDDPTRTPPGPEGSINASGQNTPDAFWNRWISAEATRRAAFAAFILDSTHATLFGHAAVMSPHDLKLPLPCDEALWSATSSDEVRRIEASLSANGFRLISFLDGLKKTFNGQKVRTNTFGRVILMAGLLNVSWHMNQRDLQVSSLGANNTLGNQNKWRSSLTRAFDLWRRDFDESLSQNEHCRQLCNPRNSDRSSIDHRDNVFESRTCLHSLAHMATHVDMIDCQVFAGADRVLGRVITDTDRASVVKRMREQWAPSARARDAVFYALRFLCEVLVPEEGLLTKHREPPKPLSFSYSARDDYLLNRPWVLYFAALIVWAYGYALDGPIRPSNYTLTSRELQIFDMQRYLIRMGGVASPDDLVRQKDRNSCLGLLLLLRDSFRQPRWELLQSASVQLQECISMLLPGNAEV